MGYVFISYSRHDQPTARRLADDLRQHGYDVWMDDRIDYGEQWLNVIFDAIRQAAAIIVLMSAASEKSDWVQKEYLYAAELKKLILPLMLNGHKFPYFVNVQVGAITDKGGLPDNFYRRLQSVLSPKEKPGTITHAAPRMAKSATPTPPKPQTPPSTRKTVPPDKPPTRNAWIGTGVTVFLVMGMVGALIIAALLDRHDNTGADNLITETSLWTNRTYTPTAPPTILATPPTSGVPTIHVNGRPRIEVISQIDCSAGTSVWLTIEASDPDGDKVLFSYDTTNPSVAIATDYDGGTIEVNCLRVGSASITVTAYDGNNGIAISSFPVQVLDTVFLTPESTWNCPAQNAGTATACAIIYSTPFQ